MKRRKTGRTMAKARVKASRRNAPKAARILTDVAEDTPIAQLTRERDEALHQQAATAEILKMISVSPNDTQPVLDAIVQSGLKLFPDDAISIALPDGDRLRAAALAEADPVRAKAWRGRFPVPLTRDYMHGVAFLDRKVLDIPDVREAPPELMAGAKNFLASGYRAITIMPLLRGRTAIGTLSVVRLAPGKLSDRQVAALKTYAAQAVIAIENTRVLGELRESLQQQTATSDVLKVISSSRGELLPAFEAMLENAVHLCEASFGNLLLFEGGGFRHVALHNAPRAWAAEQRRDPIAPRESAHILYRVAKTRKVAHVPDIRLENPDEPIAKIAGARTLLIVPMLKNRDLAGAIAIYRRDVRPFTDKQIDLVKNFAAQAVIAIENARLLNELRARTDDLSESLEQQTATSEVLKIISSSPGELEPVFNAMLENAVQICAAKFGSLILLEEDSYRRAALYNAPKAFAEQQAKSPVLPLSASPVLTRVAKTKKAIQVANVLAEHPEEAIAKFGKARTLLCVPMLRDGRAVGVFSIYRQEVRPFTDKQIELVKNFAAQAVIAIENARLLNELRARTDDLSESLEQQTATSEVLKVISSSPGDLEPVFQAILANATRICDAKFGVLFRHENGMFRAAAILNAPQAFVEFHRQAGSFNPPAETPLGRLLKAGGAIYSADEAAQPNPGPPATLGGARSLVAVPMRKDGQLIGAIIIYHQEVRPFTDKQIELLTNFAAQAVIAIENARLLNELRQRTDDLSESLEQQTATSEVLQVISSSPGEVGAVFNSILDNAVRICSARFGNLALFDGANMRVVAMHNAPPEFEKIRRENPVIPAKGSTLGALAQTKQKLHIIDLASEKAYAKSPLVTAAGARSMLAVPMLKEGELIGAINIYRQEVRSFSDKQMALLENFAAQAVIAIENTRLLNELRESLQQQTATADILAVISSSQAQLKPVFETIVDKTARICEATFACLGLFEEKALRFVAISGASADSEFFHPDRLHRPDGCPYVVPLARAKKTAQTADLRVETGYRERDPFYVTTVDIGGARTAMRVPLLKGNEVLGHLWAFRQEIRPFSDKQVELVKNFADQAVIAIENARLLNELRERTDDLSESLEQQTATSQVLGVISGSVTDAQPVFDMIADSAAKLCEAQFCFVYRFDGQLLHFVASRSVTPEVLDLNRRAYPSPPNRGNVASRAILERRVVQIPDVSADPEYALSDMAAIAGYRSAVGVPILRDGIPVGAIGVTRAQTGLLPDRQIELLKTFADQAVIAIENARLFDEVQTRTRDLSEALEQQTATSEVLGVISSSPGDLESVFQSILANATRICEAGFGTLWRLEDGAAKIVSSVGMPSAFAQFLQRGDHKPSPLSPLSRVVNTRRHIHITDYRLDQCYLDRDALAVAGVELGGIRTLLVVPLLKDEQLVGAIGIFRQDVRPFTDKQIELVSNFASQAVIAIENTRLLNELRESLQQQTATADVLKVISRSTFDLQTVLDTLVESVTHLCDAKDAFIFLRRGELYHVAARYGFSPKFHEFLVDNPRPATRESITGRTALEAKVVHVHDVMADLEYKWSQAQQLGGYRTVLGAPLLRDGVPVGVIIVGRTFVQPFTEKQIELVCTFADQAVMAIENTRLLSELRESLQQQTATSDVLKTISRSTFDLPTVLDALIETATRMSGADQGAITREIDGAFFRAANYGYSSRLSDFIRKTPVQMDRGSIAGRALVERRVVQIADIKADPEYNFSPSLDSGDFRTALGVPMLREGVPIGVLSLTRKDVRPFSEKQIELASTFADQAAIAIENVRLFESVEARTRELAKSLEDLRSTQDRLVQTQKLASLGQLTAGIAHEIKNPLNFVNNFSAVSEELIDELQDTLKRMPFDEKARANIDDLTKTLRGNLEKVVQHGKRADAIVKNMLLHSREGSGEHRVVDINAIVEESLNLAYHGARAEKQGFNITLERSFDAGAGEADVFPQDITRVLLNLIGNGFYAASKRKAEVGGNGYEPTLSVATKGLENSVEIRIRDNGTGIPPDVKEKIFNPFFTTKPAGEGTGLGLSLSHDIVVKQHGGSIEVDTRPGEFTEFRVILPRAGAALEKTE